MNNNKDILIGLLGGLTSAALLIAASRGGFFSIFLFLLVTFPIYVATLGWGTRAGIAAAFASMGVLLFGSSIIDAMSFTLMFSGLAAMLGHQVNLARENPDNPSHMVWFPLSKVLFNLAWATAIAIIVAGYLNHYSPQVLEQAYLDIMRQLAAINPEFNIYSEIDLQNMARLYAGMMPFLLPAALVVIHVINLYTASNITRRSEIFLRPVDDIANTLTLPPLAVGAMVIGLLGPVVFSGITAQVLTAIAGAFVTAMAFVGLAALHKMMRKTALGPFILFFVYFLCIAFILPFFIFSIGGIVRVFSTPITPANSQNSNHSGQD